MNDKQLARIECLKLGHRNDRTASEVVAYAKVYEAYVLGEAVKAAPAADRRRGPKNQKAEDPFA